MGGVKSKLLSYVYTAVLVASTGTQVFAQQNGLGQNGLVPVQVPEGGSTFLLFGAAMVGSLLLFRRFKK